MHCGYRGGYDGFPETLRVLTEKMLKRARILAVVAIWIGCCIFPAEGKSIKIVSWNVENLFDMKLQGTEYAEYMPGRHNWTSRILEKKLVNISEVICDLDADVVALQEVENDNILKRLQKMLSRVGCPYPYRAITGRSRTPVHVALLSRKPLEKRKDIPIRRTGHQRSILEVRLKGSPPLYLFVNHWRSKRAPESERIVYARKLKNRLEKLPPDSEYVVLGDFNSDYQEFRIMDEKHNDTGGTTGINDIMATTRDGKMVRRHDLQMAAVGSWIHENLWMEIPAAERWSHNFYGDKEALDSFLIPRTLLDGKGWEYKKGSFGVYRPAYLFARNGGIRRWEYRHDRHMGRGYSDHLPVYAVFENVGKKGQKSRDAGTKKHSLSFSGGFMAKKAKLDKFYGRSIPELPVKIKNVAVVFRRGAHAVVQENPGGTSLFVYGAASALKEGYRYDLEVHNFKRYYEMPEITDLEIIRKKGRIDISDYVPVFSPRMMKEEKMLYHIVRDFRGIYRKGKIEIGNKKIPIYFRKKRWKPAEGAVLMIKRAQIGYYKQHKELVIWDRKDFREAGR